MCACCVSILWICDKKLTAFYILFVRVFSSHCDNYSISGLLVGIGVLPFPILLLDLLLSLEPLEHGSRTIN